MKGKRNTQLNKQEWLTPQAQIQLSTVSRNNTTTPHMKQISTKRQKKRRKYHPDRDSDQDISDKRHWKLAKVYMMSNNSSLDNKFRICRSVFVKIGITDAVEHNRANLGDKNY